MSTSKQEVSEIQDRSQWSLFDRAEFALRDGGFDLDDAHRYAHAIRNAEQQPAGDGGVDRFNDAAVKVVADAIKSATFHFSSRPAHIYERLAREALSAALRAKPRRVV